MKEIILILTFTLISGLVIGQEKYIEVKVADTIMCKVDVISYVLAVEIGDGISAVENYLKERGIFYVKTASFLGISYEDYFVNFKSWSQVDESQKVFIEKEITMWANPIGNDHILLEAEAERLKNKVLRKSESKAKLIADSQGRNLGGLLLINDVTLEEKIEGFTIYPPLPSMTITNFKLPNEKEEQIEKSKTFIVRYKVEE